MFCKNPSFILFFNRSGAVAGRFGAALCRFFSGAFAPSRALRGLRVGRCPALAAEMQVKGI
jgi:hypothetical protein